MCYTDSGGFMFKKLYFLFLLLFIASCGTEAPTDSNGTNTGGNNNSTEVVSPKITSFEIAGQISSTDDNAGIIKVIMPYGADLSQQLLFREIV